jgi:hypothetical protein
MDRLASRHTLVLCPLAHRTRFEPLLGANPHTPGNSNLNCTIRTPTETSLIPPCPAADARPGEAMPHRQTKTRDAALRRLSTANRCLVAGSVALTGVFAEVAAQAFPGNTVKASSATRTPAHASHKSSSTTVKSLQPPAQAPQASTTPDPASPNETPSQESAPSHESSSPSQESAPAQEAQAPSEEAAIAKESAPAQESQPAQEPAKEAAPAQETAPAQESAPVVSGGS